MRQEVTRLDYGTLGNIRETPQGGIRVPANLTRVGIFEYKRADGTTQRELRRPSEVFHPDSLASLAGAPVTDLHPQEMVKSTNYSKLSKGHVADGTPRQDGDFVAAELVIQDDSLVSKVKRKDHSELSCGYGCVINPTPGVVQGIPGLEAYEGQRYDCEQTFIRYNHVATGPKGWGRAGPDVRMRLDSAGNQVLDSDPKNHRHDSRYTPMNKLLPLVALAFSTDYTACRIDTVEYKLDTAEGRAQALQALNVAHQRAREVASRTDLDPEKAKGLVDEVMATFSTLQTQLMALAVACTDVSMVGADAAMEPPSPEDIPAETLDAFIAKRVALHEKARKLAPVEKVDGKDVPIRLDGLSERDIFEKVIRARMPEFKTDGVDTEFLRGYFEALPVQSDSSTRRMDSSLADVRSSTSPAASQTTQTRQDSQPVFTSAEQVRQDSIKKSRSAWKKPLEATRQDIKV